MFDWDFGHCVRNSKFTLLVWKLKQKTNEGERKWKIRELRIRDESNQRDG